MYKLIENCLKGLVVLFNAYNGNKERLNSTKLNVKLKPTLKRLQLSGLNGKTQRNKSFRMELANV